MPMLADAWPFAVAAGSLPFQTLVGGWIADSAWA